MDWARITEFLAPLGQAAWGYLTNPVLLTQLGTIAVLFLPALVLSWRVEPRMVAWASGLKGMPGILRLVVEFLNRLEWLFFTVFLAVAYLITTAVNWPTDAPPTVDYWLESNYLIYAAMVLAAAWLAVNGVSHLIRSRPIGLTFAVIAWVYVATSVFGLADDVSALLDGAGFDVTDNFRVSLLWVLQAVLLLGVPLWLALTVGNLIDQRIQQFEDLTPSLRVLIGKILRITLIIVAAMIALPGLGIDLTALTVLSGAIGVGIGFGLQKVVSNFISGVIILMDQSIKPGDTVTLGETFGWIRELRARFVSVITRDGREFLIPNEDFITTQVINWSFSDQYVRLDVLFGVAYDSDPHEVERIAIEAASSVERVEDRAPPRGRKQPRPPVCWLTGFGESSLEFKLRFWISDPQEGTTNIRGKVLLAVWDAFKENGIRIPYPHREIIMRSRIPENPGEGPS